MHSERNSLDWRARQRYRLGQLFTFTAMLAVYMLLVNSGIKRQFTNFDGLVGRMRPETAAVVAAVAAVLAVVGAVVGALSAGHLPPHRGRLLLAMLLGAVTLPAAILLVVLPPDWPVLLLACGFVLGLGAAAQLFKPSIKNRKAKSENP